MRKCFVQNYSHYLTLPTVLLLPKPNDSLVAQHKPLSMWTTWVEVADFGGFVASSKTRQCFHLCPWERAAIICTITRGPFHGKCTQTCSQRLHKQSMLVIIRWGLSSRSETIHLASPASFPAFPRPGFSSSARPLLITNNNLHVWSICFWANIKWVISAKFVWRDIAFSWEGELEAESVLRLSQQMLSGSPACAHRPPSLSSHSHSRTSALSGPLPASSLYSALYPSLPFVPPSLY